MGIIIIILIAITFVILILSFDTKEKSQNIKARMATATSTDFRKVRHESKREKRKRERRLKKGSSPLLKLVGNKIGNQLQTFLPEGIYEKYNKKLTMAGMKMNVTEIFSMKIILSAVFLLVVLLLLFMRGAEFNIKTIAIAAGALGIGFILPDMQIKQGIQKRHDEIEKTLPFTLDLLKICVEAGLDMNSGFSRVVHKTKGPLADELGRLLYEIRMGKQRGQAMLDMAKRTGQPDLTSFITIVVQGEKMGMSMGKILAMQSEQIRNKRSQRIREKAAKIPIKMMIPMVLFILPAMFIILLGPAAIMIMRSF